MYNNTFWFLPFMFILFNHIYFLCCLCVSDGWNPRNLLLILFIAIHVYTLYVKQNIVVKKLFSFLWIPLLIYSVSYIKTHCLSIIDFCGVIKENLSMITSFYFHFIWFSIVLTIYSYFSISYIYTYYEINISIIFFSFKQLKFFAQ